MFIQILDELNVVLGKPYQSLRQQLFSSSKISFHLIHKTMQSNTAGIVNILPLRRAVMQI